MRVVESISIQAPAATIWSALEQVSGWPRWTPTVSRVEALDSQTLRVGARYRVHQPTLRPAIYIVNALKSGEAFTWVAKLPGVTMTAGHTIVARADGSDIELSFEISGWLRKFVARRYGALISQYVATEARSLKQWCEATR